MDLDTDSIDGCHDEDFLDRLREIADDNRVGVDSGRRKTDLLVQTRRPLKTASAENARTKRIPDAGNCLHEVTRLLGVAVERAAEWAKPERIGSAE